MKAILSIIVPVYNVDKYLERCMCSLAKQDSTKVEIIYVDDGSTDESGQLCDGFADKYNNVSVQHKTNGGLASARNYGLRYANGQYVSFVDSDDYVSENYAAKIIETIENNPGIDVIGFSYAKIKNDICIKEAKLGFTNRILCEAEIKDALLPNAICNDDIYGERRVLLSSCTYFYKKEMLFINNIFFKSEREVVNEDYLFNFEVLSKAQSIYLIPEILYFYDMREGSLSHQYHPDMYNTKKNLYSCCVKLFDEVGLLEKLEIPLDGFWIKCMYECILEVVGSYFPYDYSARRKGLKELLSDELFLKYLNEYPKKMLGKKGLLVNFLCRNRQITGLILGYQVMLKIKRFKEKR